MKAREEEGKGEEEEGPGSRPGEPARCRRSPRSPLPSGYPSGAPRRELEEGRGARRGGGEGKRRKEWREGSG